MNFMHDFQWQTMCFCVCILQSSNTLTNFGCTLSICQINRHIHSNLNIFFLVVIFFSFFFVDVSNTIFSLSPARIIICVRVLIKSSEMHFNWAKGKTKYVFFCVNYRIIFISFNFLLQNLIIIPAWKLWTAGKLICSKKKKKQY